jgi:hypothetical protein
MFLQPCAPTGGHYIARLQYAALGARKAAPHQTRMAAVFKGQQGENGGAVSVTARRKHDTAVSPIHPAKAYLSLITALARFPQAL